MYPERRYPSHYPQERPYHDVSSPSCCHKFLSGKWLYFLFLTVLVFFQIRTSLSVKELRAERELLTKSLSERFEADETQFLGVMHVLRYLLHQAKAIKHSAQISTDDPSSTKIKAYTLAKVRTEQAPVYSLPSNDSKPLMALQKGAELLLEDSQSDFFRITTPKGNKAWIEKDSVREIS